MKPSLKSAIVTSITDNFVGIGATFVASLFEHKGIRDQADFVVLYHPEWAPLSGENKRLLYKINPDTIFLSPEMPFLTERYLSRFKGGVESGSDVDARLPNKKSVYIKLHLLFEEFYDRILWIDSDMLIVRNIMDVLNLPVDFAAVPSGPPNPNGRVALVERMNFNSGLFLLSRRYMRQRWQDQMIKLLYQENFTQIQDQSILNFLFRREPKLMLPHNYNWKISTTWDTPEAVNAQRHARAVHFVGPAKWRLRDESLKDPLSIKFHQLRQLYNIPLTIDP